MDAVVEAPVDVEKKIEPPRTYGVVAISEEFICSSRFVVVLVRVFGKTSNQAFRLADRLRSRGAVWVIRGLPLEIAETKAQQADDLLAQEVGGCGCETDRKLKFKVECDT